ncbi:MAG: endonuclease/exonuclease/phosphatase family metal-dependent hydrolase [Myxococcota bacterium]|jgi:endonuclease/exonuclease/phosphatase family metal-dependent hydrolase
MSWLTAAVKSGAALLLLPAALLTSIRAGYRPEPVEPVEPFGPEGAPPIPVGEAFTVLCWNLQFAGSRKHHFFYDGGPAVHVPPADVEETVRGITALLSEQAPDIALLQEIDRDADRTGRRDQLRRYRDSGRGLKWASTPYHRAAYVPHPTHEPMGRVDLHLGMLSRRGLLDVQRIALPLLDEPRIRQAFNLKRALMTAVVPIEGGGTLRVANTHLSAFSRGDGTLARQVAVLKAWMESQPPDQPWLLAGDFNLLPPGDTPARLSTESDLYADDTNPIGALLPAFREAFGDQLAEGARTYQPFGASGPDRKIDYVFYGGPLEVISAEVLRSDLSDHLPLSVTLRLTD